MVPRKWRKMPKSRVVDFVSVPMHGLTFRQVLMFFVAVAASAQAATSSSVRDDERSLPFGVWIDALKRLLDEIPSPTLEREYPVFAGRHSLPVEDRTLRRDDRRLRLLFEATRDGGFWHLRWAITNQYPSSRRIWRSFITQPTTRQFAAPSATAECDEVSALLAMLARRMHVRNVGLLYPTWNHTISAWAPLQGRVKGTKLVMLPTTQILLECTAGFDQTSFTSHLRNIQAYPGWVIRNNTALPAERANWLLEQIRDYAGASPELWSLVRAKRAHAMGSSMGPCTEARRSWYEAVDHGKTDGDIQTLRRLGRVELGIVEPNEQDVLAWLADAG